MAKRLGLWLALALAAVVIGLLAAPQGVFVADLIGGRLLPAGAAGVLLHVAFETGLWGAGLGVWVVARRLRWIEGRLPGLALIATPAVAESLTLLGLGRVSGGVDNTEGLATRLAVGGVAVVWVIWRTRRRS